MDNENVMDKSLDEVDELYHYGVPGMKWGVRRTPAQLGHKTGSKKRRAKAKKYVESLMKKHKANKEKKEVEKAIKKAEDERRKRDLANRNKSVKDMSDDELREHLNRVRMEREAYMIDRDIEALNPKKVSAGKKFANEFKERALGPAAMEAGRKLMSNLMNKAVDKALGNGGADAMAGLKKEAEKAGYQQIISNAKNAYEKARYQEHITNKTIDEYNRSKAAESNSSSAPKKDGLFSKMADRAEARSAEANAAANRRRAGWESVARNVNSDATFDSPSTQSQRTAGQQYLESRKVSGLLSSPIAGYLPAPKDDD